MLGAIVHEGTGVLRVGDTMRMRTAVGAAAAWVMLGTIVHGGTGVQRVGGTMHVRTAVGAAAAWVMLGATVHEGTGVQRVGDTVRMRRDGGAAAALGDHGGVRGRAEAAQRAGHACLLRGPRRAPVCRRTRLRQRRCVASCLTRGSCNTPRNSHILLLPGLLCHVLRHTESMHLALPFGR